MQSDADIFTLSMHRHHQKILDQSFWKSIKNDGINEPLLLEELRQEASLRAWVRQLDLEKHAPTNIPDKSELKAIQTEFDWKYGTDEWWHWAIWSTCTKCSKHGFAQCDECLSLVKFTDLYNDVSD